MGWGKKIGFFGGIDKRALAFTRSIGAFVDSVRQDKTPPVTGEDGLRALLIEEAIVVSHAQKAAVTIAEGIRIAKQDVN